MSAWLVSKTHIDVLVHAKALLGEYSGGIIERMSTAGDDELGRMLWRENMRSLRARYGESVDQRKLARYRYAPHRTIALMPLVAFFKAIHCYEYQACEHDEWEASDARAYCRALESALVNLLPGYDAAPWGIEDPPETAPVMGWR